MIGVWVKEWGNNGERGISEGKELSRGIGREICVKLIILFSLSLSLIFVH